MATGLLLALLSPLISACASKAGFPPPTLAKPAAKAPVEQPESPHAKLASSTVTLLSLTEYFDGDITRSAEGSGSGFVVDVGGKRVIATAAHVIGNATSIEVFHPSGFRTHVTKVLARDKRADLAVLEVEGLPATAKPVALGDDNPKLAQDVVLISSPLGLDTTLNFGTVSAFRPQWKAFQLAAGVSPGSSGGLAATRDGRVLGIIRSKASASHGGENITLITPARHLRRLLTKLNEKPLALAPRFARMQEVFSDDVTLAASRYVKGRLAAASIDFIAGKQGVQHYCAHVDQPAATVLLGVGEEQTTRWTGGRGHSCASFQANTPVRIWIATDKVGEKVNVRVTNQS